MHHRNKMPAKSVRSLRLFSSLLVIVVVCLLAVTPGFVAAADNAQQAAQDALQQAGGGGRVLGVSTETDSNGRQVYAVKILSNGRVRVIRIPKDS